MRRLRRKTLPPCLGGRAGFTLVEILVVLSIIMLVALIALPVVYASLNGRQVTDAARIFTGALVGIRDSAIRYNEPRGIRLLPDPTLTIPSPGSANAGTTQLVYNRMIPIEPAGDYAAGRVTIGPQVQAGAASTMPNFPPFYAYPSMPATPTDRYPFPFSPVAGNSPTIPQVLMIEEAPYLAGYMTTGLPNEPTNWYWTLRVGDKIKIAGSGRAYTIVGPCTINPWASGANQGNPEMFVNVGAPGADSPLLRTYTSTIDGTQTTARPQFLFLVNGTDDDNDGRVDEGFDGTNQNPPEAAYADAVWASQGLTYTHDPNANTFTDEPAEWEGEIWQGTLAGILLNDQPTVSSTHSPSDEWALANQANNMQDLAYVVERRPVPSPGAREVMLPTGMVIDATTWNSTKERSRIPVSLGSLECDVMVDPNGVYIPTTQYSTPTSANQLPFMHFWVTSREDVHPVGSLKDTSGNPILATTATQLYLLPMPSTALGKDGSGNIVSPASEGAFYPAGTPNPILKGDRRLVTMFLQSGLIVTNSIESIPPLNAFLPGEGFNVANVNYPFLKAQQGLREAR